jgi:hypothetical protein
MKALYFSLALLLCGVLFGSASGCVVDFPDELPYACETPEDCGGSPQVCAALPDGRKYCCKPEEELCNRLDDDCNGVVDDLKNELCYTGLEVTKNVGACRQGKASCGNGNILCVGEVLPSEELCNGKDDNCDGTVDEGIDFQTGRNNCGRCDQVCTDIQDCVSGQCVRRRETTCADAVDNDTDTLVDCKDPDCSSLPCGDGCTCLGGEKAETSCANGVSDEGDAPVDCADTDCDSRSCGAGCLCLSGTRGEGDCLNTNTDGSALDDEGDGQANCADSDCADKSCGDGCVCRGGVKAEDLCDDGLDNDGDGQTDCLDSNCNNKVCGLGCICATPNKKEVVCFDGLDNDGDGQTDCRDQDCSNVQCIAADENGARCDYSKTECAEVSCGDAVDNDRDSMTDCADPQCETKVCNTNPNRTCTATRQCQ